MYLRSADGVIGTLPEMNFLELIIKEVIKVKAIVCDTGSVCWGR